MTGRAGDTPSLLRGRIHLLEVSLRRIGAGNPRLEAELILSHGLQCPRVRLFTHPEQAISPEGERRIEELLDRRLAGEPLAYVLGSADFMGYDLRVGPGVLIPRSETELLVEIVESELQTASPAQEECALRFLDAGTGSGAILIALAARNPGWVGVGADLSPAALDYARDNAARHGVTERAGLVRGDLLEPFAEEAFDAVLANPPYVAAAAYGDLPREIREHEPRLALDGGPGGIDLLRRLVREAWRRLKPGGLLALELAPEQGPPLRAHAASDPAYETVRIVKDLAERDRFLLAHRRKTRDTSYTIP
ncbi:MAG: peptide chain release factor N(5)-glutamine methyltransferase [Candidatus Eisenbacteria bacterium]|nr:peptide chain release factor N(5)-glutamine methyltransferase [Candidatus Eisenbacteria bacterium]